MTRYFYTSIDISSRRFVKISLFPLLLVLMASCSQPVAVVNGKKIEKKEYIQDLKDRKLLMNSTATRVDDLVIKNVVIDSLVEKYLILEEAKKQGIAVSDSEAGKELDTLRRTFKIDTEFRSFLKQRDMGEEDLLTRMKEKLIINRFMFSLVDISAVSLQELKSRYEMKKSLLSGPMLKVSMIDCIDKESAERMLDQIRKTSFEAVVEKLSKGVNNTVVATKPQWVNPEFFSPELSEIIKGLKPQGYAGPIQRKDSWYIIKLYERQEKRYRSYEDSKEGIMFQILHEKRLHALIEWVRNRRENSKIIIYTKRL
jgi:parvulin-like peptidyl-prolyl isomerase